MSLNDISNLSLSARSQASVWHPFTQMKIADAPIAIVKGEGIYLYDDQGKKYVDAISSWWTCLHGHSHPYIAQKISEQALNLEHVIFAGFTHEPAVRLAERLLEKLPNNLRKIFYSDNGSTAVEVGIKMAFQFWVNQKQSKTKIIAFKDSYHGDTFGAMSVGSRSDFTKPFFPFLFDVAFVESPARDAQACLSQMQDLIAKGDVAAIIYEPLVQGAGGMLCYSSEVLDEIIKLCKHSQVLCIADEVMTGFYRTGKFFAGLHCKEQADIVCLSKGLTGGVMAMGVTACSQEVYEAFLSDNFMEKTFFHGHSFTANPIACAAANASLDLFEKNECIKALQRIEKQHQAFGEKLKQSNKIEQVRIMGTILAFDVLTSEQTSYGNAVRDEINSYFLSKGILIRPLGNTFYLMPPYCMSEAALEDIYQVILEFIK